MRPTAELLRLYGCLQAPEQPLQLRAGALRCDFEGGAIRAVQWQGVEILRGISYLLRDGNWGTAAATLEACEVDQGEGYFTLRFAMRHSLPEGALRIQASVDGHADGRVSFQVHSQADVSLSTNRCGFVVLHPASVAGVPLQIEHTDGSLEATAFPAHVSPGQVAFNIRRLRHTPRAGLEVDCLLQAELPHDPLGKFEMEDQRNWSDASFKTYVASLLDPWPYTLQAGVSYAQQVRIQVHDARLQPNPKGADMDAAPITFAGATGQAIPQIGLGVPLGLVAMGPEERQCVLALQPAWLVAEVDAADASGLLPQLAALQALAQACSARVQLDVICAEHDTPEASAQRVAQACQDIGLLPDAVRACPSVYLQSYQPSDVWPQGASLEDYAGAFAHSFPTARIGGGMLTYFTELNRKRQSQTALAFVGHATCPLVHAADDVSVMQTHESLASIVASVRHLWPDLGYRLGPISLGMQRNPYGRSVAANPERVRRAMAQDDPRHHAAFGAAWIAGYAAAVIDLDLELLSFNYSHGVSGPLLPGTACIPAWRVQAVLGAAAGCALHTLTGLPQGVAGIAWHTADGRPEMLLANLSGEAVALPLQGNWSATDIGRPCPAVRVHDRLPDTGHPSSLGAYQVLWLWQ